MSAVLFDTASGFDFGAGHVREEYTPLAEISPFLSETKRRSFGKAKTGGVFWTIVPARPEHIPHIAANMREADVRELAAGHGKNPIDALRVSLEDSPLAWTGFVQDEPVCMFGAALEPDGTGSPWLLATGGIYAVERTLARQSRKYVRAMLDRFPYLENYVAADNVRSRRWLAWCGFQIAPDPEVYGVNGGLFHRFWMGADHV